MKNNKYKCPICGSNIYVKSKVSTAEEVYDDYNDEYVSTKVDLKLDDLQRLSYSNIRYHGHGVGDHLGTGTEDRKYEFSVTKSEPAKVKAYVCKKCGHIEFFIDPIDFFTSKDKSVEMIEQCSIAMNEYEKWLKEAIEFDTQYKQLNSLSKIVNNPDKTIREVNDAKAKLKNINKQKLEAKKKDLFNRIKTFLEKYKTLGKYGEKTFDKVYEDMQAKLIYWKKHLM